jgi:hypothetical protein
LAIKSSVITKTFLLFTQNIPFISTPGKESCCDEFSEIPKIFSEISQIFSAIPQTFSEIPKILVKFLLYLMKFLKYSVVFLNYSVKFFKYSLKFLHVVECANSLTAHADAQYG